MGSSYANDEKNVSKSTCTNKHTQQQATLLPPDEFFLTKTPQISSESIINSVPNNKTVTNMLLKQYKNR